MASGRIGGRARWCITATTTTIESMAASSCRASKAMISNKPGVGWHCTCMSMFRGWPIVNWGPFPCLTGTYGASTSTELQEWLPLWCPAAISLALWARQRNAGPFRQIHPPRARDPEANLSSSTCFSFFCLLFCSSQPCHRGHFVLLSRGVLVRHLHCELGYARLALGQRFACREPQVCACACACA